jgi:hypothetical protein
MKGYWHLFFSSQEFRESAKRRMLRGDAPHLESYLLNKVYGKPREEIDLRIGPMEEDLTGLSLEELAQRAEDLTNQLRDARELEAAIPAEYLIGQNPTGQSARTSVPAETPAEVGVDMSVNAENPAEPEQGQC